MAEHVHQKLKPRTAAHYQETLERLILPRFATWRVDSLTKGDVEQWHSAMAPHHPGQSRPGHPVLADGVDEDPQVAR